MGQTKKVTPAAFDKALDAYAAADAQYEVRKAAMEQELQQIRNRHATGLDESSGNRMEAEGIIRQYADDNRADLLTGEKKSVTLRGVTLAWKTNPAKLVLCEGITWEEAVEKLQKKKLDSYLSVSTAIDKTAIIRDRDKLDKLLPNLGMEVCQDETLTVKAKKEAA